VKDKHSRADEVPDVTKSTGGKKTKGDVIVAPKQNQAQQAARL